MSYKKREDEDEQQKSSAWGRCCAPNCSVPPSALREGRQFCTFHNGKEYHEFDAITDAFNNLYSEYEFMLSLHHWSNDKWKHHGPSLLTYQFLPATREELALPHRYVERLYKHLRTTIRSANQR